MTAAVPAIADLTSRLRNRVPVHGHNGRSGAILERASLDGEAVIIKTVDPAIDVTMRLVADTVGREHDLWQRGVLDDLGPRVTHAIISAGRDRRQLVTVMRDLGNAVLGWDRRLSRTELSRVFAALAAVHHRFAGAPPAGLVDLPTRLTLLTPRRMAPLVGTHPLATAVIEGWQHFFELVADPLAAGIEAALGDPARLLASLEHASPTLCHGDAWLVNMALTGDDVVLLDWNLATAGPAALDFVTFAIGCSSHVDATRETVLRAGREACRDLVDDDAWDAAVVWALCELGWNKALDAVTHDDPTQRLAARDELAWWTTRAEHALARIGSPASARRCSTRSAETLAIPAGAAGPSGRRRCGGPA
jgi:hypothetical protein